MDKVISTRVDEAVAFEIENLSKHLRIPKKEVIENAVRSYAAQTRSNEKKDVFDRTCGAWMRDESPAETVEKARKAFNESMQRHHR